jgi:hypothetical protein
MKAPTPSLTVADFQVGDAVEFERGYGGMSAPVRATVLHVGPNWLRVADEARQTSCISIDATVRRVE